MMHMSALNVYIELPGNVRFILHMLREAGHEAYVVGGCVRDSIMGRKPHDWDICTSAKPEQVIEIFNHYKVIPTGLKHGTVTIMKNDKPYEITTYRVDGEYDDARHPKDITFTTSLEEDLSRRDFTMNALAYNNNNDLVDLFGGVNDIKNGIVRCVGNPRERFSEDALRIMRALRFATRFGFKIEENTFAAMKEKKSLLSKISAERINSELTQIIMCEAEDVARILYKAEDILFELFPALRENDGSYINNILHSNKIKSVRLALLFDFPEEQLKDILTNLRYDNETISSVLNTRKYGQQILKYDSDKYTIEYFLKRIMHDIGYEDTQKALFYCIAYSRAKSNEKQELLFTNMLYVAMVINDRNECYKLSQLAVNGNDIKHFGYKGQQIGTVLNYLLDMVMKGVLENNKPILLKRVEELGEV